MDKDELKAYRILTQEYGFKLDFEPNGTTTFPDFKTEDNIAIEVTRCNKLIFNEPIEKIGNGLVKAFKKKIESINHGYHSNILISFHFKRPINNTPELINSIVNKTLDEVSKHNFKTSFNVDDQVTLTLFPLSEIGNNFFLSSWKDSDSANIKQGVSEARNIAIRHSIERKEDKAKNSTGFKEYWLVIIDYISLRDDSSSLSELNKDYSYSIYSKIIFTTRNLGSLNHIELK